MSDVNNFCNMGIGPVVSSPITAPASIEKNIVFEGNFASDAGSWAVSGAVTGMTPIYFGADVNFPATNLQNDDLTIPCIVDCYPSDTRTITYIIDLGSVQSLATLAILGHNLANLSHGCTLMVSWAGAGGSYDPACDISSLLHYDNYGIIGYRNRPIFLSFSSGINARYVKLTLTGSAFAIPGSESQTIIGRIIVSSTTGSYQMQRQFDLGSEFSDLTIGMDVTLDNIHTIANPQIAAAGSIEFVHATETDRNGLSAIHAKSLTTKPVLIFCHPERIPVFWGAHSIADYVGNKEAYYAWFDDKQLKWRPEETLATYATTIKFHSPYLPR